MMGFSKKWSKTPQLFRFISNKELFSWLLYEAFAGNILANNHSDFQISIKEREIKIADLKEEIDKAVVTISCKIAVFIGFIHISKQYHFILNNILFLHF